MNKYLISCIAFLLISTTILKAQENEGFKLSNFQTPDFSRKVLGISLDSESNFSNYNNEIDSEKNSNGNSFLSTNLFKLSFGDYTNSRDKISYYGITLNTGLRINNSENFNTPSYSNKITNSETELSLMWNNKRFIQPKFFLIYNINSGYDFEFKKYNYDGNYIRFENYTKNRFNFTPAVGVGIGRIEDVTDARQALYIIEALENKNVLSRKMTAQEINEFARVISSVKNKRFLDARLHKIEELTAVDEFLNANELLKKSDISYFTELNDMWEYGDLFPRKSGYELSLDNSLYSNWYNAKFKDEELKVDSVNAYHDLSNVISLNFNYCMPSGLNWQHDFLMRVSSYFPYKSANNDLSLSQLEKMPISLSSTLSYKIGYYPNTRTNFYASILTGFNPKLETGYGRTNAVLGLGTYYYFSPNLRLSANVNMYNTHIKSDYSDGRMMYNNNFSTRLEIGFNYFIF